MHTLLRTTATGTEKSVGFLARGTKRSFSDFETNSPAVPAHGGPRRRRGNRAGSGQQVNQHQNMDQKGNGKVGGKGGKRQHPINNKQGQLATTRDGAQICFRFATSTDRDARTCACVSEMLAASPKQLKACTARGAN